MILHGWIVCDGQTLRLRSRPSVYGGQVLAQRRASPEAVAAWDALGSEPVRPGSVGNGTWRLATGEVLP